MTDPHPAGTRHLVDPTFQLLLDLVPPMTFTPELLAQARALRVAVPPPGYATPPNIETEGQEVPGPPGDPDVIVYVSRPTSARNDRPAVLWIHGGGYVLGSAEETRPAAERMSAALDCVVVAVNYRLAPEVPHPGPVEDCLAALTWLHASADELGVDPDRIAVVGESAGGGLAAALALLVRDRGSVPLCFQGLIYPMIDDRTAVDPDPNPSTGEFIWTQHSNAFGWRALLGHEPGLADVSPYAAAARATDVSGLPPTFIGVGALDLFVDENLEFARRLIRAGVPTELHVHPGAVHGYFSLGDHIPRGKVLFDLLVTALGQAMIVPPSTTMV